jgi:hypothetical protein
MNDRIRLPSIVGAVNPKSLEKFSLALENGFQGISQKSFAEAARPGKKIGLPFLDEIIERPGLIGVSIVSSYDFGETGYSNR